MSIAIVTGSAGLIGAEAVRFFAAQGLDIVGIDNDMRRYFFGDGGQHALGAHALWRRTRAAATGTSTPTSATQAAMDKLFARYGKRHRFGHPHRGAALARLGGARTVDRFHRQRQRHAEPAGGDARNTAPTRRSSSPAPTRSMATRRTGCRWSSTKSAGKYRPEHPLAPRTASTRHVDRCVDAQPVRRLEGGGRCDGAGVRPLLRHEDRLLPRRLPHRPRPFRRRAARLPGVSDEVRGHRRSPTRVFGYKGKQVRDNIH